MNFEELPDCKTLQGEIVKDDCYKLQSLVWPPDVIFDIGANIGVFTHHAHKLFPNALIVAVEPHPVNYALLLQYAPTDSHNVILLNKAIGSGAIWRYPDVTRQAGENSAGESYTSRDFDYQWPDLHGHAIEPSNIQPILLDALYSKYVKTGQRLMIKIDCEGAENILFEHPPSVAVLRVADFVSIELHPYWSPHVDNVSKHTEKIFRDDYRFDYEIPYFYAWKKPAGEPIVGRGDFGVLLKKRGLLGNAAEIGVCSGSYSRDILDWGVKNLLLVDPWRELPRPFQCDISDEQHEKYYQECLLNIKGCEGRTTIMRTTSVEAAKHIPDESLDFCYIDANHRYDGISVDLPTWWPKVRRGGILAGHDYLEPNLGVNRAVTEFAAAHNLTVHTVIEHQRDASFWIERV